MPEITEAVWEKIDAIHDLIVTRLKLNRLEIDEECEIVRFHTERQILNIHLRAIERCSIPDMLSVVRTWHEFKTLHHQQSRSLRNLPARDLVQA